MAMFMKFYSGDGAYAVDITDLSGVIGRPAITPVPMAPPQVAGIFLSRGKVWTAVEPGALSGKRAVEGQYAILLDSKDGDLALLAQSIGDIFEKVSGDEIKGFVLMTPESLLAAIGEAMSVG